MKLITFLTLSTLLSISACSHHKKSCCGSHDSKEKMSCTKDDCKKACCDKDKKCTDGSCSDAKACEGDSCKKKS